VPNLGYIQSQSKHAISKCRACDSRDTRTCVYAMSSSTVCVRGACLSKQLPQRHSTRVHCPSYTCHRPNACVYQAHRMSRDSVVAARHCFRSHSWQLRSALRNLRCSKISIGRVSAEEPGVQSKLRGHHIPIRKGFGTQSSAEVVTDLYWTIQII
jgi:hypothetical protein